MASNCQPERSPKIPPKKKGGIESPDFSGMHLAMRFYLGESSRSAVTQLTPNPCRNGHCSLGMDENLDHLRPHDTSFQMIILFSLYIHALVYSEVLSHHISSTQKHPAVSYFLALAPLTWILFRCRSSRATVRFIFKASAKA